MLKRRLIRVVLVAVPTLLLAIAVMILVGPPRDGPVATRVAGDVGGPISLVDQTGAAVTEASFAGRWVLLFFGFTTCPDVCPTELASMAAALDALGPNGDKVDPVFVTVDPERDTPAALAGYVGLFHPRLSGLTGTPEQVAAAAAAFKVFYERIEPEGSGPYLMQHTAFTYLLDPSWNVVDILPPGTPADEMAARLGERLAEAGA